MRVFPIFSKNFSNFFKDISNLFKDISNFFKEVSNSYKETSKIFQSLSKKSITDRLPGLNKETSFAWSRLHSSLASTKRGHFSLHISFVLFCLLWRLKIKCIKTLCELKRKSSLLLVILAHKTPILMLACSFSYIRSSHHEMWLLV